MKHYVSEKMKYPEYEYVSADCTNCDECFRIGRPDGSKRCKIRILKQDNVMNELLEIISDFAMKHHLMMSIDPSGHRPTRIVDNVSGIFLDLKRGKYDGSGV
jgi:hypothetical protein